MIGYLMKLNTIYYIFLILVFFQMIVFQLKSLDIKVSLNCLKAFKSNNFLGLIVFLGLVVGKI